MKPLFLSLLAFFLFSQSALAEKIVDVEKINSLKKGESTSEFVLSQFGKPDYEDHNPDGRYIFQYPFSFAGKTADQAPLTGTAAFLFGPDSKLMAIRFYKEN